VSVPVGSSIRADMFLYNVTLQRPGAVTQAVAGSFSAPKTHEIVAARGDYLELLRPDDSGKVETVHRCVERVSASEVFAGPRGEMRACEQPLPAPNN
jgi:hypothetical protein